MDSKKDLSVEVNLKRFSGWIVLILIVFVGIMVPVTVSLYRTWTVEAKAGRIFTQMQKEDVADTLRGEQAFKLAQDIRTTLYARDLLPSTINTTDDMLASIIRRGWERDAREALYKLYDTHNDPLRAKGLADTFEKHLFLSGRSYKHFGTSAQDIADKHVFRNLVEDAITHKLPVSAADCVRAGIPIPTKTMKVEKEGGIPGGVVACVIGGGPAMAIKPPVAKKSPNQLVPTPRDR